MGCINVGLNLTVMRMTMDKVECPGMLDLGPFVTFSGVGDITSGAVMITQVKMGYPDLACRGYHKRRPLRANSISG